MNGYGNNFNHLIIVFGGLSLFFPCSKWRKSKRSWVKMNKITKINKFDIQAVI